jgi:hypothetical protein
MSPIILLIAVVAIFLWLYSRVRWREVICADCGSRNSVSTETRGSFLIEIVLWLCVLLPGLIYSLWRFSSRHPVCSKCGSVRLIPLDTPAGRELATRYPEPRASPVLPPESCIPETHIPETRGRTAVNTMLGAAVYIVAGAVAVIAAIYMIFPSIPAEIAHLFGR